VWSASVEGRRGSVSYGVRYLMPIALRPAAGGGGGQEEGGLFGPRALKVDRGSVSSVSGT